MLVPALLATVLLLGAQASTTFSTCEGSVYYADTQETYYYDLSPLSHAPGRPDLVTGPDALGNSFYVNLCGATTAPCSAPDTAVCQQASNGRYYCCGTSASQRLSPLGTVPSSPQHSRTARAGLPGEGVTVTLEGGQRCSGGSQRRTAIRVVCDPRAVPGFFVAAAEEGPCSYALALNSSAGCGSTTPRGRLPAAYVASALSSELLGLEVGDRDDALLAPLAAVPEPLRVAASADAVYVAAGPRVVRVAKGDWRRRDVVAEDPAGLPVREVSVAGGTLWYVVCGPACVARAVDLGAGRQVAEVPLEALSGSHPVRGDAVDGEHFAFAVPYYSSLVFVVDRAGNHTAYSLPCTPRAMALEQDTQAVAVVCSDDVHVGLLSDFMETKESWALPKGHGEATAVDYHSGAVWVADKALGVLRAQLRSSWRVLSLDSARVVSDLVLERGQ
eukprot:m51a1_g10152 hypothetical protein (445) ;mRNA; r:5319-6784